jgi:hypothetical protein
MSSSDQHQLAQGRPTPPAERQQHQQHQQVAPLQSSSLSPFACQWTGCGESATNAEELYVSIDPMFLNRSCFLFPPIKARR